MGEGAVVLLGSVAAERSRNWYDMEQRRRPPIMTGRVARRIRRRPMRSMMVKATRVQMKLVTAMERDVNVGEENPIRENMVAEKYMSEF